MKKRYFKKKILGINDQAPLEKQDCKTSIAIIAVHKSMTN